MDYCLFTYLGKTSRYEEKLYYFKNNEKLNEKKDKFYIKYLTKKFKISKIYLFTTEEIIRNKENLKNFFEHFGIEEEKLRKYLGRNVLNNLKHLEDLFKKDTGIELSIKVKQETFGEKDLKELLNIIKQEKNLLFDITHSYRDIPLLYLSLLNLITSAEDLSINTEFLYVREINNEDKKAEIEILRSFKEFQEWSYAIYSMKKSFNLIPLADLLEGLENDLSDLANSLRDVHLYFNLNALKLLEKEVRGLKDKIEKNANKLPLPFKLVEKDIKEFLNRFNKKDFTEFQKEIWKFSFENKMYDKSILALREYIISEVTSIYYEDIKNERNRKNIETLLSCKNFIENNVGEEIKDLWFKLSNIRNQIAHLKGFDKIEKKTKKFVQDTNIEKIEEQINSLKEILKEKIPTEEKLEEEVEKINKDWNLKCKGKEEKMK